MESIFFVGDPRTVVFPSVFPKRLEVLSGRERFARARGDRFLKPPLPAPPDKTEVDMGSRVALAKELPKNKEALERVSYFSPRYLLFFMFFILKIIYIL